MTTELKLVHSAASRVVLALALILECGRSAMAQGTGGNGCYFGENCGQSVPSPQPSLPYSPSAPAPPMVGASFIRCKLPGQNVYIIDNFGENRNTKPVFADPEGRKRIGDFEATNTMGCFFRFNMYSGKNVCFDLKHMETFGELCEICGFEGCFPMNSMR